MEGSKMEDTTNDKMPALTKPLVNTVHLNPKSEATDRP
jgi:hypothetical protein